MSDKRRVALLLPKGHEYATRLIEGIVDCARDRDGFELVEVPYDEHRTPPAVYHLEVAGALVWAHHDSPWVLDLRDRGVKLVSLNSEWLAEGIPCVGFDLDAVADAVVAHLAGLGREHAAYLGHLSSQNPAKLRLRDEYLERARANGWSATAFEVPGIPSEERHRLAEPAAEKELIDFLRGLNLPAVIYSDDDYVGVLVCRVAEHLGLAVPDDVAVLGFYDLAIARFATPTLSSIPAPGQLVGAAGMQLLGDVLDGRRLPERRVMVAPPPVAERESTGAAVIRDDDIRRARQLIEELACQGLTVNDLLARLCISQKTLNKRFMAVFDEKPGEAIRRVRLERAQQWLGTTDLTIGRIAQMCGFGEPSNFNLFFRRELGCTPTEYRKRSRRGPSPGSGLDI